MSKAAVVKKERRALPKTPVQTGWVVVKRYKKTEPDPNHLGKTLVKTYERTISKLFSGEAAAKTFLEVVKKYPPLAMPGEHDAEFYVSTKQGHDDLPAGL